MTTQDTITVTICGNNETILSSHDQGVIPYECWEELGNEWTENVWRMLGATQAAGVDIELKACHRFAEYNGGKYSHQAKTYGQTGGRVSCPVDAPAIVREACDKALAEADAMLEESIDEAHFEWDIDED